MKKSFLTGVFVLVPLVVSVALLLWFFEKVDGLFSPVLDGVVRALFPGTDHVPGTGILAGLVIILLLGTLARNVAGKRLLDALDRLIQRIPGYRTVYSTIKQLTNAFSPDSTKSFKEVLLVEFPKEGSYALGFRTMTVEEGDRRLVGRVRSDEQSLSGRSALHPRGESGPARDVDRAGGPPARVGGDRRAAGAAEGGECRAGLDKAIDVPVCCQIHDAARSEIGRKSGCSGSLYSAPGGAGPEPERVAHHLRRFGPRGRQVPAVFLFRAPGSQASGGFSFCREDNRQATNRRNRKEDVDGGQGFHLRHDVAGRGAGPGGEARQGPEGRDRAAVGGAERGHHRGGVPGLLPRRLRVGPGGRENASGGRSSPASRGR